MNKALGVFESALLFIGRCLQMPSVSKMIKGLKRSGIRELMELSAEMDQVIHLEVGEPLFDTPAGIIEEAFRKAREGFTKYTPNRGFTSLRASCAERLNKDYGLQLSYENIIITVGAVSALAIAVRALINPGEEVLIPDPGWPNYDMIINCANGIPQPYRLKPEEGFLPRIADLEQRITLKTKAIIINTPSNPLGTVYPPEVMKEIVEFAKDKDLFVISDEVYEKIIYTGEHTSALSYDSDDQVIATFSFSKTYAMTGWRVGYIAASQALCNEVGKLQEAYVSCACSVSQKAAEAALAADQGVVEEMVAAYRDNLNQAVSILDQHGLEYFTPSGAFYMWIKVGCDNSSAFARSLLKDQRVAVAPGTTFGDSGAQYVRISLASPREAIAEGVLRLAKYVRKI